MSSKDTSKIDEEVNRETSIKTTGEGEDKKIEASNEPVEFQNEVVDMNDPSMDGLEWFTRKVLPIPKVYYWETENYEVPLRIKAWHRTVRVLGVALHTAESIGGFFANAAGLNSTRYDYVTSTMTEEQLEEARKNAAEQREKREVRNEQKTFGPV